MIEGIAMIGDAGDPRCWSGTAFYFGQAARSAGEPAIPWNAGIEALGRARWRWNLAQLLRGGRTGGYQYSSSFLDRIEKIQPGPYWKGRIVTFNQHFPRGRRVADRGGHLVHYIDATFASLSEPGGSEHRLPARVREKARALEQENYAASEQVVTMATWAAESAKRDCGVPAGKVSTILPGANFDLPEGFSFAAPPGRPGIERPLALGFVGKDWKRKGLPFLLRIQAALERMGMRAVVRCAGHCPVELQRQRGLEYAGFIDKTQNPAALAAFLAGCDLGCLFSEREPLGISTLEFLRAGVPVTGFTVEGIADTIPPDAGFRFDPGTSAETVALTLYAAFRDDAEVDARRAAARQWSPLVSWQRCVDEWLELLRTGTVKRPVQPWRGLTSATAIISA